VNVTTKPTRLEPLWDVRETAAFLRVSTKWVYERASRGDLPCLHVGGCRRFDPAAIRLWLAAHQTGNPPGASVHDMVPTR
jgi:predicted DNA-binding transcriptional regulator AlpA